MFRPDRGEDIEERTIAVPSANLDPLVDPADLDVYALVDAVWGVDNLPHSRHHWAYGRTAMLTHGP
jgi:hypothetical protein